MGLNRRKFLEQSGLGLLTFSLGMDHFSLKTLPYLKALAQSNSRKLALLVGINQYQNNPLKGCLTDVEMQRELLINRFGFLSSNILTLTNQAATKENIEIALKEYLSKQIQENDVVIFHFSGLGSQVLLPDTSVLLNSLVPIDGGVSTKNNSIVNDILEDTLILWSRSLSTNSAYLILDTGYQLGSNLFNGNFRLRVFPQGEIAKFPNLEELAFQEQLKLKIKELTNGKILNYSGNYSGTILKASDHNNCAIEAMFNGFSAGLFTYCLTQFLWEITPPSTIYFGLKKITEKMSYNLDFPQQPILVKSTQKPQWFYSLLPNKNQEGIGFISSLEDGGETVILKLVGLPQTVINNWGINSIVIINLKEVSPIFLQIKSKDGLTAKAKIINPELIDQNILKTGQVVRELLRIIPINLSLIVGLDPSLSRIEKVDATSSFTNIDCVSTVVNLGETAIDCILKKSNISEEIIPNLSTYNLAFANGLNLKTMAHETVKSTVNQLNSYFELLLAQKFSRLLENEGSSQLKISAVLEIIKPQTKLLLSKETGKSLSPNIITPQLTETNPKDTAIPNLIKDTEIQLSFENNNDFSLYFLLIAFDHQQIFIFSNLDPKNSNSEEFLQIYELAKGTKISLPSFKSQNNFNLNKLNDQTKNLITIQGIFSADPFLNTLSVLPNFNQSGFIALTEPLTVIKAIFQDLDQASKNEKEQFKLGNDCYVLNVNHWASFHFMYQV